MKRKWTHKTKQKRTRKVKVKLTPDMVGQEFPFLARASNDGVIPMVGTIASISNDGTQAIFTNVRLTEVGGKVTDYGVAAENVNFGTRQ